MASKSQEVSPVSETTGKSLLNQDGSVTKLIEWATEGLNTPEEILDYFSESGLSMESQATAGDYILVNGKEKPEWCKKHEGSTLAVVQWHFYENRQPQKNDKGEVILDESGNPIFGEFVAMHLVSRAGKFLLNDSAKIGMYGQLRRETDVREERDPESAVRRSSTSGLFVPGGLKQNAVSYYDTRTNKVIKRADLNDAEAYPLAIRAEMTPTWKFNL